jgi:hypothetical protein
LASHAPLFTNTPRHAFLGGEIHESASGATWLLSGKELLRVDVARQQSRETIITPGGPDAHFMLEASRGTYADSARRRWKRPART